jgi:hypothetical protein
MTDYRLRNQNMLYAERGRRPLNWRNAAIFGSIAAVALLGVVSFLADRFNTTALGLSPAAFNQDAQQKPAAPPGRQFATPGDSRFGS